MVGQFVQVPAESDTQTHAPLGEMIERVGLANIVIFGLTAEQVEAKRREGYAPREVIEGSPELSQALDRKSVV